MRRSAFGVLAIAASVTLAAPHATAAMEGSYASVTTRIAVKLTQRLSSQDAQTGDEFGFDTTASVALDGLFLAAGTHGRGIVTYARSARGPAAGVLRLEARTIDIGGGRTLPVGLEPGQLDRKIAGDVRGVIVPVAGAPVYIGSNRNTNVVYEKGTPFVVVAPPPATPDPDSSNAPAG